jgi:hypothetical protein
MNKQNGLVALIVLCLAVIACKTIAERATGADKMAKAGELWSDVPRMENLSPSDLELPWGVKLLMKTALNNLWRFDKEGEDKTPAEGDWIAFTLAGTPTDVQNFYTRERMSSFGNWEANKDKDNDKTCIGGKEDGAETGLMCVFNKTEGGREKLLAIWAGLDEEKKQTTLFYLRIEKPVDQTK